MKLYFWGLNIYILFLLVVLILYYLEKEKYRNYILLIVSLYYYFYGEPKYKYWRQLPYECVILVKRL